MNIPMQKDCRIMHVLFVILLFFPWLLGAAELPNEITEDNTTFESRPVVRIGVLAFRPKPQTLEQWRPLGVLLSQAIPQYDFVVEALTYPEFNEAVEKVQLDFVLTNSGNYILLKKRFGLTSPLATLGINEHGKKATHFGGVIFTAAKTQTINTLHDIKGKTIAITDQNSFGGYQMQAYALLQQGIHTDKDTTLIETGMPHDNVVNTVLLGHADVGFIRTGVLEQMVEEGKIKREDYKIINAQHKTSLPVESSTNLYPEWPLSALPHIDEKLSRNVLATLFKLEENSALAKSMHIYGFNIPADYAFVEEMLRALRIPPFDTTPTFSIEDIWITYRTQIMSILVLIGFGLLGMLMYLLERNQELKKSYTKQQQQANALTKFSQLIEQSPISIIITDLNGNITYANAKFFSTTGYSEEEIIGQNPRLLKSSKVSTSSYRKLWSTLKRGEVWEGELINRRKDGTNYIEWGTIAPLRQADGKVSDFVAMKEDITQRKNAEQRVHQLAFYDQLTSLPNRQKIIADMEQDYPKACAIFNIDSFKEINDLFGISAGDDILVQVGEWFQEMGGWFHEMGFLTYRTGGDEFTVLFRDNNISKHSISRRIATLMSFLDEKTFHVGEENISLRMSTGIAIGSDKLLTHADIALNLAKEKKITFSLYEETENIEGKYRHNIAMATMIRKALIMGRIICYYQPIVDFQTKQITKYETLVRMVDEEGTIIAPLSFLPIAKKMKIYPRITQEVINQACTLFQNRTEEFSINLSTADMEDARAIKEIIDVIQKTNTASRIVFEILESEGIENYEKVGQFIAQVKALGAKIAIDDFGTGYSNFEHILRLNVDYIKIDGSLIRDITQNTRNTIIIETIVDFAKKVGAKTIAEFVSDKEIFDCIKKLGVDYSQGYYTGKPEPLEGK